MVGNAMPTLRDYETEESGTCRSTSKCVCNRHGTLPAPDCRFITITGLAQKACRTVLGLAYGTTDLFGNMATENPVHDLHATILHLRGLDHERLTYRYSGRDFRLTDVHGKVMQDILA